MNKTVYTLGYQGISILEYVDLLKENKIKLVCDVRNNAFSFKFGFSKKKFAEFLKKSGIDYIHFPDLGVESAKRKQVGIKITRAGLFRYFVRVVLKRETAQTAMLDVLKKIRQRTSVLTCYEQDPFDCHRSFLAEELNKISKGHLKIVHLHLPTVPKSINKK